MHIIEVFGRVFISTLFIVEGVKKIFNPDMSMIYMSVISCRPHRGGRDFENVIFSGSRLKN